MDRKLRRTLNLFTKELKARLAEKEYEGFYGWDNNYSLHLIQRAETKIDTMRGDVESREKESIDIANLMMMIWYRRKSRKKAP